MMNKKFLKTILFGGLFLSLTGAFVSCAEDYSDDIQNLQTQITTNSNAIAELQALLAKGVVITSVEKNAEGILLTLSDGSTQQLTNGADGKDGQNGADGKDGKDGQNGTNGENGKDADVWTIDEDGFWCLNGKPTEYKAVAEDGKDGQDGTNGGYYRPNAETGFFDYVAADGTVTPSTISWTSSTLTAVQTETGVWLSGYAGAEDRVFISSVAELKSLVFKPQLVVDGVNAIKAGVLMLGSKGSEKVLCAPAVYAEYHMNPSTVKEAGIKTESLQYVALTMDYKKTRAISNVTATYNSINVDSALLKVNVAFNGIPSTGAKIDLIALQVENAAGEVITSDYATVDADPIYTANLAIARKSIIADPEAHYWTSEDAAQEAAIAEAKAATDKEATDKRILAVKYNSKNFNLYDYVSVCDFNRTEHSEFNMGAYHMHLEFSMGNEFKVAEDGLKEKTDQQKFITLDENGVVTPKTYEAGANLRSSIGRTPIIKAQLVHEDNGAREVVETRWIALEIVDTIPGGGTTPPPAYPVGSVHDVTTDAFLDHSAKFLCDEEIPVMITAEQMNVVYSKIGDKGISKEDFAANFEFYKGTASFRLDANNNLRYDETVDVNSASGTTSEEVEYKANVGQITSYGLIWTLTSEYLWNNVGKTPTATAVYKHKTKDYYVVINLTAEKAIPARPALPSYTVAGNKIDEMWYTDPEDNKVKGMFNVRVPNVGESNSNNCTFVNQLLSLYIDNEDPATLANNKIKEAGVVAKYVIKGAYCKGYAGFNVVDGNKLYLGDELLVTLNGTAVTLNHASEKAKELLNTNAFYVTYAVEAKFTSCLTGTIDVLENASFDVRYVRPLNVNPEAVGYFQDGNDFGSNGTLIEAAQVISLVDWRGNSVVDSGTYYGYYGVKNVTVDNSGVTCNMAAGTEIDLPSHIKAGIVDAAALKDPDLATGLAGKAENEWFYYKNNGTVLQEDIEINFPVIVEYFWGKVVTDTVTVTVKKTNNINKAAQK